MPAMTPSLHCSAPVIAVWTLFCLAGSVSAQVSPSAVPPQLAVGDHWQYKVTDNLRRASTSQLDVEVLAVTGATARIRFQRGDAGSRTEWIDEVDGAGGLVNGSLYGEPVRPFSPPAKLLAFPLDQGKTWRQVIDTVRKDTGLKDQILIYGRVQGPDVATVSAGKFDIVYVYRILQLDDVEFWRTRTTRRDAVWYAPAAKAAVREQREAEYIQTDGFNVPIRTESTVFELVSFQPGVK